MSFKGQGQVAHTSCKLPLNFRKGKRDKNLQTKIFRHAEYESARRD